MGNHLITTLNWKRSCIRNQFLKRMHLGFLGLLLAGETLLAQNSSVDHANLLKMDLFGPATTLFYSYPNDRFRFSVEYERLLSGHFSLIIDSEYDSRDYEFVRYFEWPGYDPPIQPRTLNGWTKQHDLAIIPGLRWFAKFGGDEKPFRIFVEPRIALVWRHALLFHEDVGLPPVPWNEFGIGPRFRTGLGWSIGSRLSLEGSADLRQYKYIGNGKRLWGVIPEINLGYRF